LLTDDFNDNTLNQALWTPMTFGGSTLAEMNQRLEFTASDGAAFARLRGLVIGNFDLRFNYSVLPSMNLMDPDEDEPAVGALFLGFDSFLIRTIEATGGATSGCIGAQADDAIGEGCYASTAALSGGLRLTRVGTTYSIYERQASDWALLTSGVSASAGPVDFYLGGGTGGQTILWGAIDDFWLQAGGFQSEVPEPASFVLVVSALGLAFLTRKRRGPHSAE